MLVLLASADVLQESKITNSLMQLLKANVAMDSLLANVDLLKDCLLALAMIFGSNPSMISEFGEVWTVFILSLFLSSPFHLF